MQIAKTQDSIMKVTDVLSSTLKNEVILPKGIYDILQNLSRNISTTFENKYEEFSKAIYFAKYELTHFIVKDNNLYNTKLSNEKVNKLCEKYSQESMFKQLKEDLFSVKNINVQIVNDALLCFEKSCYYGCISLLFNIIDRQLIIRNIPKYKTKSQSESEFVKNYPSDVFINGEGDSYFSQTNFLTLLFYYYKYGDNFSTENSNNFPLVNRNFIAHGMTNRIISKYDCIKLLFFISCMNKMIIFSPNPR